MNMQCLLANKFGIPRSQMPQLQQWKLMEPACEFISHIVLALAYSTLLGHKGRRAPERLWLAQANNFRIRVRFSEQKNPLGRKEMLLQRATKFNFIS